MPQNLTAEYSHLQACSNHRAATKGTLNIPIHKTTKFKSSVLYRTVKTWNDISGDMKKKKQNSFKTSLQADVIHKKYGRS